MKKILALLLAVLMLTSLAACGDKTEAPDDETTTTTAASQKEENTEPTEIEGDPAEYGREYWEEKYPGENICPFTIDENGKEYDYYWVSSFEGWDGTFANWINQPFNWNGWHKTADGAIVNEDETLKITDNWANGEETMSSFCTITTEPYEAPAES